MAPLLTWIAILVLLAVNAGLASLPLGSAKLAVNLVVAAIQVTLVGLIFMRLDRAGPLVRLTAVSGLVWLSLLFIMAGADYLTRA